MFFAACCLGGLAILGLGAWGSWEVAERLEQMRYPPTATNVRADPGTDSAKLLTLTAGEAVLPTESSPVSVDGREWIEVYARDQVGWVAADLLVDRSAWERRKTAQAKKRTETTREVSARTKKTSAALESRVQVLRDTGLLHRFDVDANRAYVEPAVWSRLTIDVRQNVAATLAEYCDSKDSTERIEIVNKYSGKKLAKYSGWGYKDFE